MNEATAPLCHGVDLVHVPQLRDAMTRNKAFEARVFTEQERAYCNSRPDPLAHFAARFAAKEAACKALGLGLTPLGVDALLRDVEVRREGTAPRLALTGKAARRADRLGIRSASVSLSHAGDSAIATVILVRAALAEGSAGA